jgi:hypothetical protein
MADGSRVYRTGDLVRRLPSVVAVVAVVVVRSRAGELAFAQDID